MFNLNINGTLKQLLERSDKRYKYFFEWHGSDNDATYQGYITFESVVDLDNDNHRVLDVLYNLVYEAYYSGENKICTIPFTFISYGEGGTTRYTVHAWKITNTIWTAGQQGMRIQPVAVYYIDESDNNCVKAIPSSVPSIWIPAHGNAYDTDDASYTHCKEYPDRGHANE